MHEITIKYEIILKEDFNKIENKENILLSLLYMEKPLSRLIFFNTYLEWNEFLEILEEDKDYVGVVEFVPNFTQDFIIILSDPFLFNKK